MQYVKVLLVAGLLLTCSENDSSTGPPTSETYDYQAFDTLNHLLVSGWLALEQVDSVFLAGSWHFSLTTESFGYTIGPQVGYGES